MSTNAIAIESTTAAPVTTHRVTLARVVRSEWTKLWSLRSTRYSLLIAAALMILLALAASAITASHWHSMSVSSKASFDALNTTLFGVQLAELAVGVLGVLMLAGEYTTGAIRSTLSAVPKRLPVLWAKALSLGAVVFVLMLISSAAAIGIGRTILSGHLIYGHDIASALTGGTAVRGAVGAALYLTLVAVFGIALAAILRSTAAGIATLAGILFVLPGLANLLPSGLKDAVWPYLPGNAGSAILNAHQSATTLAPWTGLALFAGYTAVLLATGALLLKRRDA
jgi:ABC-2 type transport system permease protein